MADREDSRLIVARLTKRYHLRSGDPPVLEAVSDISFEIAPGECFGLLGPNGAGKSTTIQCISGFYPASSGRVTIGGFDVHRDPKSARQLLGVCSQEDTLDTDFSVRDQLARYATFFRVPLREGRRRADELLRRFGLDDKAEQPVESLSGGMRRRLQVARTLISEPRVLLLDEPTTGLDPEVRRLLWDILMEARGQGVAMLLSTHYMDEAERLCDRVAMLHQGKILDCAAPQDLIERHIGAGEVEEEVRPGVVWRRPPNLEDVYLKVTGARLEVPHAQG
ncbi:MAG TPA: ABC transporter ATP-binding protein [Kofleriaceae bacterium]|nr:ABC transporter ATP-binding protein [Kofleriaceae bacterium]